MISKRLQEIASNIPPYTRVADIGADHAWLLIHLATQSSLELGIAGERNRGPYLNAWKRIQKEGLQDCIEVRLGDGLAVLQPKEVEVVVIAGMGGHLIEEIVDRGKNQLQQVKRLVIQPNQSAEQVRRWLRRENWALVAESIVQESGVLYEVLVAEPGHEGLLYVDDRFTEQELEWIGPLLWKERDPLLLSRAQEEAVRLGSILQKITHVRTGEGLQRQQFLLQLFELWKKVITCLSMEANSSK